MKRRAFMKTAVAGVAAGTTIVLDGAKEGKASNKNDQLQIKVAGYDYDRVRAITNGQAGIPGYNIDFEYQDIYTLNQTAFGSERTYDVTELGLIPYIQKFGNDKFRAYTLIPVFISRIFRHRRVLTKLHTI